MDQLDLNDIRAALGAVHNMCKDLVEKVDALGERMDDIGAVAARTVRVDQAVADVEDMVMTLPSALRKLANDPMVAPFGGHALSEMADDIEAGMQARRAARSAPPAIERTRTE